MTTLLLKNASVLDVVAGTCARTTDVLIKDGVIVDLDSDEPDRAVDVVRDLSGRVLMPGLCDAHVHTTAFTASFPTLAASSPFYVALRAAEILSGMLQRGFTTVRDAGGADWGLAKALREGVVAGPRLLYCGRALSQTGGHGDMRGPGDQGLHQCFCGAGLGHICDGVPEVLRAAREEVRRGATQLKIMASGGVASPTDRIDSTQFSEDELRAIVGEANAANIPTMAHAYTASAINRSLRCGVTSIEHGNLLDEESVELFLAHDGWLVPTLVIYTALVEEGAEAGMDATLVEKTNAVLDAGLAAFELAYRSGVNIAYGTDLLGQMHRRQSEEFAIRRQVASNADLIRQATVNAARLFRMESEIGQVAPGFTADLIVVRGNPLDDIEVLARPDRFLELVIQNGTFVHEAAPE